MIPTLPPYLEVFDEQDGWPRPRWEALWAWVEANVAEADRHGAACALEGIWLSRLSRHLGGAYVTVESNRFFVVAESTNVDVDRLLETAEETLRLVDDALELAPDSGQLGKIPVILFSEDDDFYDYLSPFFDVGHYGRFAGVCVREGDAHVALRCPPHEMHQILAHELTHARLVHLELPVWLEEGVVEVVMRRVVDQPPLHLDAAARERHYAYWSWHGLSEFWDGRSFSRPDELQQLSYELAESLVRAMNAENPEAFNDFLLAADQVDAGDKSCRQHLGRSVTAFVARVLGEGPWLQPPEAAPQSVNPGCPASEKVPAFEELERSPGRRP